MFVGPAGSLGPVRAAAAARDLATPVLVVDRVDAAASPPLRMVAEATAETAIVDTRDPDEVVAVLEAAGITAVTTFVDGWRPLVDVVRSRLFGAPRRGDTWGKDALRRRLSAAGVSSVEAVAVDSVAELHAAIARLGRPVVVKPVDGVASRDLWLVRDDADQARLAASTAGRSLLVERYVDGPSVARPSHRADYLSAELFVTSGGTSGFLTERPPLAAPCRETGIVGPSTLDDAARDAVLAKATAAVAAVDGGSGAYHVELKLTDGDPVVIEVNGRLGGYVDRLVELGTGRDVGHAAVAAALDRPVDVRFDWHRSVAALLLQAPVVAATVAVAPARRDLAGLPGVLAVDHISPAGTALDWRDGTGAATAKLWVAAADEDQLRDTMIGTAHRLAEAFEFHDGNRRVVRDDEWLDRISGS